MAKNSKTVVHLRVYRGLEMLYDANQKPKNENQIVKVQEPSIEWDNFMAHLRSNAYCKVDVEKVTEVQTAGLNETVTEVKDTSKWKEMVSAAFTPKTTQVLTEDQKRIAELEKKLEALTKGKDSDTKSDTGGSQEPDKAPELPEGKSLDDLKRGELDTIFPGIAETNPQNVDVFRDEVRKKYPDAYKN